MKTNNLKISGYILVAIAVIIFATVVYKNSGRQDVPLVFAPRNILAGTWDKYKILYIEPNTFRTLDKQQDNITTSEGQSYTMLRAVWLDDHQTFDRSWQWTKDNLKHDDKNIFAWLFGQRSDGSYGILTEKGGQNSASDADVDIALALVFAYSRWKDEVYLNEARAIINDIWSEEIIMISGRPYQAADNVEKNYTDTVVVNPSYLAPYAYRIFAEIDKTHDWEEVVDTSYEIIEKSMKSPLDKEKSAGLPPNWITISRTKAEVYPPETTNITTNYGYDALRVPWRLALDYQWYKDSRARELLRSMTFLEKEWQDRGLLHAEYTHDGKIVRSHESPAMYGGSIGALMQLDSGEAREMYENKLQRLYNPDTASWKTDIGYYDANWAWFGIAIYNNELPNLWESGKNTEGPISSTSTDR